MVHDVTLDFGERLWSRDVPNLSQWRWGDTVTSRYSPLAEIRRRGIQLSGDNARRLATVTGTKGILHETRITPNTRPRPTPVARSTLKEIVTS